MEQIATYLNTVITDKQKQEFSKVNQQRTWAHRSVQVILTNDYYIGKVTYGGEKISGNHEAIVDIDTWLSVSRKVKRNSVA